LNNPRASREAAKDSSPEPAPSEVEGAKGGFCPSPWSKEDMLSPAGAKEDHRENCNMSVTVQNSLNIKNNTEQIA
jgi:hypothetical protein